MKNLLLAALLLLSPLQVWACISVPPTPDEAARGYDSVGYVTGEEYPDYEATLIKEGTAQYSLLGRHIVRVTFTEALIGPLLGPMALETPCYATKPSAGDRAVVIRQSGHDYVLPATPEYESAIRAAIARLHGR
jgi:hypothetical protein